MELNPEYIKDHIAEIGVKEGLVLLKEFINSSSDSSIRNKALEYFGTFENGKNFAFLEQLFLSDEDQDIALLAGKILKDKYLTHKKLTRLLEYTLHNVENVGQKIFSIEALISIDSLKARKMVIDYVKSLSRTIFEEKTIKIPPELLNYSYNTSIPQNLIDICINLILHRHYVNRCGYLSTLRRGMIISLVCESSNLQGINEIVGLHFLYNLEYLTIQRNHLKEINQLKHLTNLKNLNLSHNDINKIENLNSLITLEELNLSNNKILRIENLEHLSKLKKLFLNSNEITYIENLDFLAILEVLEISRNKISKIENLGKLDKLTRLSLAFNRIEKMEGLRQLQNLMWLYLNDNAIVQIEDLSTLQKLKGLYLSNNNIERISSLENLQNLKKIELSNNKIRKLEGLQNLVELQELYLDNNSIEKLEGLEGLNNLIILHVGRNAIKEFSNESVEHLKNLNFIFLNENPLNQKSFSEYQKRVKFP
ncbi:MAG: leucine-rich repeat domain-containing protein [Promethearchaeota archaeon]